MTSLILIFLVTAAGLFQSFPDDKSVLGKYTSERGTLELLPDWVALINDSVRGTWSQEGAEQNFAMAAGLALTR
ncbi:MAG: hypothetical protein H6581_00420 [Bacteroidia bacterium]|nr:hypothetical protein [Bacteroidia bacterium]